MKLNQLEQQISDLVERQVPGHTLDQMFYTDPAIFEHDMQRVVFEQWLVIDHESRIANRGDYFVVDIAGDEIIIVREDDNKINGFYNTCRHRGSKVCLSKEGNKNSFVCPYHAWTYNLDGSLRVARLMNAEFDKNEHGLHKCHINVYEGIIFVCLSDGPPPNFDEQVSRMQPFMDLHGLDHAKVAHRHSWRLQCNWKLVIENFIECYHCLPLHPELSSVHSKDKYKAFGSGAASAMPEAMAKFESELEAWRKQAKSFGYTTDMWGDDENSRSLQGAQRLPINFKADTLSETRDGKLASTLMGKFSSCDGGTTAVSFNPLSTLLMPNDYAMIFRFTPISAEVSDVEVIWLVDKNAQEGVDYDLENLIWLWYETTVQDGDITENNQIGVRSRRYKPGPYSQHEAANTTFLKWYLRLIG